MTAQGTSKSNRHHGTNTMAGQSRIKPWPGYTQARLLWIYQNHHLQREFTSGQQSWTSKTTPKDTKTNILETIHHGKTQ
jgi:hypothetical protein